MTQTRRDARWRTRRLLFNDDGEDVAATKDEFLSKCMNHLVGSQVDTILFCTTNGSTDYLHQSKVTQVATKGQAFLDREGRDCLHVVIDFAHQHGMELFWSMRMNDVHDAHFPELLSDFKQSHPKWLLGDVSEKHDDPSTLAYWGRTALNFAVEEVRDLWFRIIEEVCANYDVDGVELDFGRMPFLFQPDEVENHRHLMTSFLRALRKRMDELGEKRGRPILLAARVAQTIELNRKFGLEIDTVLEEGLIDLLIPGFGYTPFLMPVEAWVTLGHRHDVPVYPCICNDPSLGDAPTSTPLFRAAASNFWKAGVDGIYLFNAQYMIYDKFKPELAATALDEIGAPATLKYKDKLYPVTIAVVPHVSMNDAYIMPPIVRRMGGVGDTRPGAQAVLSTDHALTYVIKIADDVANQVATERLRNIELRAQFKHNATGDIVLATLNGHSLEDRAVAADWAAWELTVPLIQTGENTVAFQLVERGRDSNEPLTLVYVELWLRYHAITSSS